MWGQSEDFSTSIISSWVFTIPCSMGPDVFVGFSLPLTFFVTFIMLIFWMIHVHSIKFLFHIVIRAPIPILAISGNYILWFIEYPGFKIVKCLNITLVRVTSFFLVRFWVLLTPSSLNCCNGRGFFLYHFDRWVVSEWILASSGSILVHYFAAAILLYSSVAFWMISPAGTSVTVSQSSWLLQ